MRCSTSLASTKARVSREPTTGMSGRSRSRYGTPPMWSSWPWVSTIASTWSQAVPQPAEVGQDHVDARLVLVREEHAAVHDEQAAPRARRRSCCGRSRPARPAARSAARPWAGWAACHSCAAWYRRLMLAHLPSVVSGARTPGSTWKSVMSEVSQPPCGDDSGGAGSRRSSTLVRPHLLRVMSPASRAGTLGGVPRTCSGTSTERGDVQA